MTAVLRGDMVVTVAATVVARFTSSRSRRVSCGLSEEVPPAARPSRLPSGHAGRCRRAPRARLRWRRDPIPTPGRTLTDGAAFFLQSVVSGDPRPESVHPLDPRRGSRRRLDRRLARARGRPRRRLQAARASSTPAQASHQGGRQVRSLRQGEAHGPRRRARSTTIDSSTRRETQLYVSHVGRAKTAPAPDTDVPVKFAYVSCQDYIGRFFNVHLALAGEELDFFVHLGDYIYETSGDPSFQNQDGRKITFTDQKGAIALGSGDATYYAASSLDNYRQLYKTYRGDKALQGVHEKFAMIATLGRSRVLQRQQRRPVDVLRRQEGRERRRPAPRTRGRRWFEYMPVDYVGRGLPVRRDQGVPRRHPHLSGTSCSASTSTW